MLKRERKAAVYLYIMHSKFLLTFFAQHQSNPTNARGVPRRSLFPFAPVESVVYENDQQQQQQQFSSGFSTSSFSARIFFSEKLKQLHRRVKSHRLSKDETMWLFPHRIDPMFEDDDEENNTLNNVRSGRSERSCHVWFENGYV